MKVFDELKKIKKYRMLVLFFVDILIIISAHILSLFIIYNDFNIISIETVFKISIIAVFIYELFLNLFMVYKNITRYENGNDYLIYIFISLISCLIEALLVRFSNIVDISLRTILLASFIIMLGFVGYRIIIRYILNSNWPIKIMKKDGKKRKNLLIIGAGAVTGDIIKTIKYKMDDEYNIIGIIDDNRNKIGYTISGVKVLGARDKIESICKVNNIDLIFFTIPNIDARDKKEILEHCRNTKAKIKILPSTEDIIKNKNVLDNLRDIEIEDILYRNPIILDNKNIEHLINNKVVLVTGGGGSIGSELCRQIIKYSPSKLLLLDIYENNLYDIELELKSKYENVEIIPIIASIREAERLDYIFDKYRPYLVFHAAAHKHVPLMENNPLEAIKNNVFGTYNLIQMSDKYSVKKYIQISTDKAVNPTNIMGATKRMCEMMVQAKNKVSNTEYAAVRFGNVLGSNGSVVPLFKKQIAEGGPITVTHKDITRFFMTIPEAVSLVLQAMTYAKGGEIFVLDMGEPVKIYDLAENLIKLAGLEPNVDINIKVVGLRPGEKLYEELLLSDESLKKTKHEKIYIEEPSNITMEDISEKLKLLSGVIKDERIDIKILKDTVKKVVPTYIERGNGNE